MGHGVKRVSFLFPIGDNMLKKITALVGFKSTDMLEKKIWAWVEGGCAVHPSLNCPDLWAITHVNTGFSIFAGVPRSQVGTSLEYALKLTVGNVPFHELPACEALTLVPILQAEMGTDQVWMDMWKEKCQAPGIDFFCAETI